MRRALASSFAASAARKTFTAAPRLSGAIRLPAKSGLSLMRARSSSRAAGVSGIFGMRCGGFSTSAIGSRTLVRLMTLPTPGIAAARSVSTRIFSSVAGASTSSAMTRATTSS